MSKAAALEALTSRLGKQYGQPYVPFIQSQVSKLAARQSVGVADVEEVEAYIRDAARRPRSGSTRSFRSGSSRTSVTSSQASSSSYATTALSSSRRSVSTHSSPSMARAKAPEGDELWNLLLDFDRKKYQEEQQAYAARKHEMKAEYKQGLDAQLDDKMARRQAEYEAILRERDSVGEMKRKAAEEKEKERQHLAAKSQALIRATEDAQKHAARKFERHRRAVAKEKREIQETTAKMQAEEALETVRRKERMASRAREMQQYVRDMQQEKQNRYQQEVALERKQAEEYAALMDSREQARQRELKQRKEKMEAVVNSMGQAMMASVEKGKKEEDEQYLRSVGEANQKALAVERQRKAATAAKNREVTNALGDQVDERARRRQRQLEEQLEERERMKAVTEAYVQDEDQKERTRRQQRAELDSFLLKQAEQVQAKQASSLQPHLQAREVEANAKLLRQMQAEGFAPDRVENVLHSISPGRRAARAR
mmetsp:Transcript_57609/g.123851  ORF Transcript_57609/g.123851 Transcript_57609/m.123851 type:complete len:484 (+) Transcript_57609:32-1483(+)